MKPKDYKEEEFIHFIRKSKEDKSKTEMYEIPFSEIEGVDLNRRGVSIPYTRNNVINLERYLLWYWSPIIGGNAIILYLHLWEYCNQDEKVDICYPKLSELAMKMGVRDTRTIVSLLNKLQDNNFLVWAYRLNKENNNREDSPVFKLRETIPLLSKEQYEKLPMKLKKKHDQYMEKFASNTMMERFTYDSRDTIDDLMKKSDIIITKKSRKEIDEVLKKQDEEAFILENLPDSLKGTLKSSDEIYEGLQKAGFSKPASEIYYPNLLSVYDSNTLTAYLITRTEEHKRFLEEEQTEGQLEKLQVCLDNFYNSVFEIKYVTAKQFIIKTLKGK
ncbi:helix-turn-helix domain-containing protein [Heyndrickxia ginsengihumi]|uniref:helix-turn-helix domain-containing protein n=1 Tax=Heyndrickxia ginsengihumi TaxID=363870 RepID=UPI000471092A|nr:helix-turn-helix domain-containing protein [Heyndrickxia ginsengihumi]